MRDAKVVVIQSCPFLSLGLKVLGNLFLRLSNCKLTRPLAFQKWPVPNPSSPSNVLESISRAQNRFLGGIKLVKKRLDGPDVTFERCFLIRWTASLGLEPATFEK